MTGRGGFITHMIRNDVDLFLPRRDKVPHGPHHVTPRSITTFRKLFSRELQRASGESG
jgi:hypothetical protein